MEDTVFYVHSLNGISKQVCKKGVECKRIHCVHAHPNIVGTCHHSKWCLRGPLHGTEETPACEDPKCVFNHFVTEVAFNDYRSGEFNRRKQEDADKRGDDLSDAEVASNPYEIANYHYTKYMMWYNHTIERVNAGDTDAYRKNYTIVWYHYNMYMNWSKQMNSNIEENLNEIAKKSVRFERASPIPPKNNPWNKTNRGHSTFATKRPKPTFRDFFVAKK